MDSEIRDSRDQHYKNAFTDTPTDSKSIRTAAGKIKPLK